MPLHLTDKSEDDGPFQRGSQPLVTDSERMIQLAFQSSIRQGYELLFRRYYKVMCSQVVRFVYSREVAQDIVSEVFLNFWKNRVHESITTSYRAYLFTAVRNRAYNHLQEEFRRDSLLGKPTEPTENDMLYDNDPQQQLQLTELYARIEAEIKSLPPQCQRVFLLSRFEGMKQLEIAEELQISTKTVESHINKALTHLKKVPGLLTGLLLFWIQGN